MASIAYLTPTDPLPLDRHIAVVVHRDAMGDKAYFFDSAEDDHGGSASFDWRMEEAVERARKFADDRQIGLVAVYAERRQRRP